MEQENKPLSLVSPQAEFRESSIFEELCNLFSTFPKLRHDQDTTTDTTVATAVTSERGRIIELDRSSDNNDDESQESHLVVNEEAMKLLLENGGSSMPYELLRKILTYPLTLFRKPTKVIYKPSETFKDIAVNLAHLEDNGDFEEFDKYSEEMIEKYREENDFDIVAAVKVEQAQCALYKNDLRAARGFAREAHELAGCTRFPSLFKAQTYIIMSSISRYKQKLGDAKYYLGLAEQCFESGYSIVDYSHFYEVQGSYLSKFLGISPELNEQVKDLAITSFKKMGEIGSQDASQDVRDKKRFYALIKTVRILLDSNSSFGRKRRTVTSDAIHNGAECIRMIKRGLLDAMPRGSKIQFQLVESDLYYRQGRLEDAKKLLQKSLNEANEFGYKTEGPKIIERIKEIDTLMSQTMNIVEETSPETQESSSSCYDSETTKSESDVFSSEYL